MHICQIDGRTQYYLNQNGQRSYLKASQKPLVQKLCQKDYDIKVLRSARKELMLLEKLDHLYKREKRDPICESIYPALLNERKKYVTPIILPDEEYVKAWQSVQYERKGFHEDAPEFYTENGERVRSKSEVLIANALKRNGVPYRYEYPLILNNGQVIHPDFTALNVRTRKELYFEHLGMMDDENYADSALRRILNYEKNGIFPGDRLILTHETSKTPIDMRLLERIITQYLK